MGGDARSILLGPASIPIFSDRPASTDIEAFEWNPSMDLLACLTAPPDSTMSIYRLLSEEQGPKLLSEKITGTGTTLAWSPCGRKIAVGDRLGGVTVYDGETGTVLNSRRMHARPVASLAWTSCNTVRDAAAEPSCLHMLPPLLPVPSTPSNMYTEVADAETHNRPRDSCSFLTSTDEGGLIIVSDGGSFPLLAARVAADLDAPADIAATAPVWEQTPVLDSLRRHTLHQRRLRAARLSPDLRQLAVLLGPCGSTLAQCCTEVLSSSPYHAIASDLEPAGAATPPPMHPNVAASAGPSDEMVVILDVRKLAVRHRELAQCAGMCERLFASVAYTRLAVDTLAHVWRGAVDAFAGKMRAFSEAIQAHGGLGGAGDSIHEELLLTCCAGTPSDAVHAFLTRQTSPQQLARLERTLMQALDYVNLIVCTRLQVAGHHILTILHDLHACAGWAQKFRAVGLDVPLLRSLMAHTQEFNSLTEILLLECSKARRFVRTLFQVLLRLAQRFSEQPAVVEPGNSAPTKEDMDDLIMRLQARESLELTEVTRRIGAGRSRVPSHVSIPGVAGGKGSLATGGGWAGGVQGGCAEPPASRVSGAALVATDLGPGGLASLTDAVIRLAAEASRIADHIITSVSGQVSVLACIPVHAPSPWTSPGAPEELRAHAVSDSTSGLASPRGWGGSTLSISWESLGHEKGARLVLLWSGGVDDTSPSSDLHVCRCWLPPSPRSSPAEMQLERARVCASSPLFGNGRAGGGSATNFALCQMYDANHAATLVLQSPGASGTGIGAAAVCCINLEALKFQQVPRLGKDDGRSFMGKESAEVLVPPATYPEELPGDAVRHSALLPEIYVWASSLRVMKSRGVGSVYAWRARRLLTLDMEAEPDDGSEHDTVG